MGVFHSNWYSEIISILCHTSAFNDIRFCLCYEYYNDAHYWSHASSLCGLLWVAINLSDMIKFIVFVNDWDLFCYKFKHIFYEQSSLFARSHLSLSYRYSIPTFELIILFTSTFYYVIFVVKKEKKKKTNLAKVEIIT